MFFTVFTPTYNRAYKLPELFESLKNQTFTDFEWLVVDDGSTDDTGDLISRLKDDAPFPVRYIKKINEGKHVAINVGAEEALGEWFFIVDSDDQLTPDALEISQKYCAQISDDDSFACAIGLRGNKTGEVWSTGSLKDIENDSTGKGGSFEEEYIDATAIEYRFVRKISGDRAEIIKTEILKKYKFPSFEGEKFMPERYLWYSLSRDGYKSRWFNTVIYITEYLEDGLTTNGKELAVKNCKSRAFVDNESTAIKEIPLKERAMACVNYYRYGRYSGESWKELYKNSHSKLISAAAIPLAMVTAIK